MGLRVPCLDCGQMHDQTGACPEVRGRMKPVIIVGYPIIAKLIHGEDVELEEVILIPDDQLFNEHSKIEGTIGEGED